jgi:hypothetical protein
MRSHGVPDYPDPQFRPGDIHIPGVPGLDPNSPIYQRAQNACSALRPGVNRGR